MTLKCTEKSLPGVLQIEPMVFEDDRGFFLETYHAGKYADAGLNQTFVQDNHSHSRRFTLRGLHYQLKHPQGKLVYVLTGEIFDIAVDIRLGSPTFGRWTGTLLSDSNKRQLYIPEGFAHGFCALTEDAVILYKCSDVHVPECDSGILWSDPGLGIDWPVQNPLLSPKDRNHSRLQDMPADRLPTYTGTPP